MKYKRSLFAAALSLLAVGCGDFTNQGANENEITVVSFGGDYQDAQRTAYFEPFSSSSDESVVEGEYNGEYGLLTQRANAATGSWDVVSVESGPALRGERDGLFLEVPGFVTEGLNLATPAIRDHSVGHLSFATILAFRDDGDQTAPSDWSDFFDTESFPGKRALRNSPRGTLEIALMADGVPSDELYPLDVERALNKIDKIRDDLIFWDSGAQPIQLLANNNVVMTSAFNGRIWAAKSKEGLPFAWTFNQGLYEYEYWAVPKNSPNPELAFRFIRFSLERDQQASFANLIAYLPTNEDAFELISEDVSSAMPSSASNNGQVVVDASWWAANEESVSARWEQWKAGG